MSAPAKPEARPDVRRAADSTERAYRALRQALIEFEFRPGDSIREVRVAARLRLSRTPVREALNRLASEGFVTLVPNRGFVARGIDVDALVDLHELRAVVESAAFAQMCRRASDTEIADLAAFWESAGPAYAAHDSDAILVADEAFHMRIATASGNAEFAGLLETINARIRFIRRILIDHARHDAALVEDHARLVAAALARDADGGSAAMRAHVALSADVAREALKEALLRLHAPATRGAGSAIDG